MKINTDIVLVNEIKDALRKNVRLYGKPFCPCVVPDLYFTENSQDYVCPCKDFRTSVPVQESCHCGLYIKEEKDCVVKNND